MTELKSRVQTIEDCVKLTDVLTMQIEEKPSYVVSIGGLQSMTESEREQQSSQRTSKVERGDVKSLETKEGKCGRALWQIQVQESKHG